MFVSAYVCCSKRSSFELREASFVRLKNAFLDAVAMPDSSIGKDMKVAVFVRLITIRTTTVGAYYPLSKSDETVCSSKCSAEVTV